MNVPFLQCYPTGLLGSFSLFGGGNTPTRRGILHISLVVRKSKSHVLMFTLHNQTFTCCLPTLILHCVNSAAPHSALTAH